MVQRIVILVLILTQSSIFSQEVTVSHPRSYVAQYCKSSPKLDGVLDDACWEDVPWSESFMDIEGPENPIPEYDTRIKMAYTDDALFIAAQLEEPHIWATLKEKNKPIFRYDNDFEVFIDPNGDHCNYYELEINALNTIWELSLPFPYRNGGKPHNPDNMKGMISQVTVYGSINDPSDMDSCWTLEIMFPFEGFNKYDMKTIPPQEGDYWRINFSRVQWNHDIKEGNYVKSESPPDNWVWSPQYEINMHAPEHWGYLFFGHKESEELIEEEWKISHNLVNAILDPSISTLDTLIIESTQTPQSLSALSMKVIHHQKSVQYFINTKTCFWKSIIQD